jgi:SAM domain (Sterile alpha motif)
MAMDVGMWLRELGLEQYEVAFRENAVDAEVLPRLTTDDLKEMGVVPGATHETLSRFCIEFISYPTKSWSM